MKFNKEKFLQHADKATKEKNAAASRYAGWQRG